MLGHLSGICERLRALFNWRARWFAWSKAGPAMSMAALKKWTAHAATVKVAERLCEGCRMHKPMHLVAKNGKSCRDCAAKKK